MWNNPKVCFCKHAPPVAARWAAAGGAFGAPNCVHPRRFGDHKRVAHEFELASTCMASRLTQAGCKIATKKSKVHFNGVSVRAELQLRSAPLGVQATRAERNLGIDFTSGKRVSTAVWRARLEKSKGRVKRIRKINGRSSVPLQSNHWRITVASQSLGSMRRSCSNRVPSGVLLGEAAAWEKCHDGAHDGRK